MVSGRVFTGQMTKGTLSIALKEENQDRVYDSNFDEGFSAKNPRKPTFFYRVTNAMCRKPTRTNL